jgi:glycosyltransferase involved in cell wall biosynthesis
MVDNPTVSILMTAYNKDHSIARAIESVLASSFKDFELIIVDDNSKDKTLEIIKKYAVVDSRIKLFVNQKTQGDYPNRNTAASYAIGKYLKYIDADDYIYPWGLELLVCMMERFSGVGWGLCSVHRNPRFPDPFPFELASKEAYEYNYFGPGLFGKPPVASIIKRDVFLNAGGFSGSRMTGDYEMWHRLAQQHNVLLMPPGLVLHNMTNKEGEMKDHSKYLCAYEKITLEYLFNDNCPLEKKQIKKVIKKRRLFLIKQIGYFLLKFKFLKCYEQSKLLIFNLNFRLRIQQNRSGERL